MNIDLIKEKVEPHLTRERYEHTLRVAETAIQLAIRFDASKEKAQLAGILHDYAKYRSKEELASWIETSDLPNTLLDFHHELWHGPVGALMVERDFGVEDLEIRNAIHYHTTGRAKMSKLEMIIFLADYIEPGRKFPGVDEVRKTSKQDLEHACLMASQNTIRYLMSKQATIYPDTFHTYNDLTRRVYGG
ncbi:hypothetical protein M948_12715 [Virgibacillus sp. CM-4]|uniref:bis(5'-nucleosyl)-tetraphosphatase (symmetrical) YqeK n=1 Tax=Virgibacillus sp. CM-4 TaxID=1354277 RepID=UPI0003889AE8|nr:bis(5'-nucleosyl)-tetraphosphatase (symmetrical) YqeK [Virgibacillus sp. CM-4]EQB35896.1 hypothetical protein M948_12715 [Virgibacillus sp. CM-4]